MDFHRRPIKADWLRVLGRQRQGASGGGEAGEGREMDAGRVELGMEGSVAGGVGGYFGRG